MLKELPLIAEFPQRTGKIPETFEISSNLFCGCGKLLAHNYKSQIGQSGKKGYLACLYPRGEQTVPNKSGY